MNLAVDGAQPGLPEGRRLVRIPVNADIRGERFVIPCNRISGQR